MARLYTYAESPVKTVRFPQDPYMAAGYACGLPGVNAVVRAKALVGYAVASAIMDAASSRSIGNDKRSSHPKIELVKGDRTDYHINLVVDAKDEEGALAAAFSIEYGRESYFDKKGRHQPPMNGVHALTWAMAAMGG